MTLNELIESFLFRIKYYGDKPTFEQLEEIKRELASSTKQYERLIEEAYNFGFSEGFKLAKEQTDEVVN